MLNRRLSSPKAILVVALAAGLAAIVAVAPSLAGSSFLTSQKAAHTYVSNKKASTVFLKKKAAGNLYVKKLGAPINPVAGVAAGSTTFGPVSTTTAGNIPGVFTTVGTKAPAKAVITFSGQATCTAKEPTADLACPIQLVVDNGATGKVNFAPATASSPSPAALVHTVMQTTVLGKGGHSVAVQYAGAKNVTFTLKNWNLSVQAYPEELQPSTEDSSGK